MSLETPVSPDRMGLWLRLFTDALLPLLFLRAWLMPETQSGDRLLSLLAVLVSENLRLLHMIGVSGKQSPVLSAAPVALFLAVGAFMKGLWETGTVLLLLVCQALVLVVSKWGRGAFPSTRLQALSALGMFWLLAVGVFWLVGIEDRSNPPLWLLGGVYFTGLLVVRALLPPERQDQA